MSKSKTPPPAQIVQVHQVIMAGMTKPSTIADLTGIPVGNVRWYKARLKKCGWDIAAARKGRSSRPGPQPATA